MRPKIDCRTEDKIRAGRLLEEMKTQEAHFENLVKKNKATKTIEDVPCGKRIHYHIIKH